MQGKKDYSEKLFLNFQLSDKVARRKMLLMELDYFLNGSCASATFVGGRHFVKPMNFLLKKIISNIKIVKPHISKYLEFQ